MKKFEESDPCSCEICVRMCETRPCWGTPEDIEKIINAGFGKRLMLDYWCDTPDINLLCPAIVGYENKNAPFWPNGRCTFLNEKGLCELHDLGLKPTEGKVAIHGKKDEDTHYEVAKTWKNEKGKILIKLWREK